MKQITLKTLTLICLFSIANFKLYAQIAVNSSGAVADSSSLLDVSGTSKGLLIPRISLSSVTDNTTITRPAASLLVYNTNASLPNGKGYYFNNGTLVAPVWQKFAVVDTAGVIQTGTSSGDVVKWQRFPMGEISMAGNTTVTNISSANVWIKAAGTTTYSSGDFQFSNGGVSNRLQYTGSGMKMFHIACTLSVKSTQSGSNLKAMIYKNGVPLTAGTVQAKMGSSSDIISTAIHVMTSMSANDYLELWITNTVSSSDFTVTEMNMFAMGISMGMD